MRITQDEIKKIGIASGSVEQIKEQHPTEPVQGEAA